MSIHNARRKADATAAGASLPAGSAARRKPKPTSDKASAVTTIARTTLDDTVYGRIKQMILANQFRPGHKLTHQHLADQLAVSRTPVRQALERLYQEGYVIRIPDRGFFVAEMDSHEARDLYDMRIALETSALRLAMSREGISEKQLKRLIELQKTYADDVAKNAILERIMSDREFHVYLASLSGNRYLEDTLATVFERLILKRRVDGFWPGSGQRGKTGLKEHEGLLRAIRAGRTSEALRILESHLREAWAQYEAHLLQLAVP